MQKIKKQYLPYLLLTGLCIIIVFFVRFPNSLFGSTTDWLAQHVTFPEYFRQAFYQSGDLFPDFLSALGGGQNMYNISYYGFLRPDVLLSYMLPFLQMKTIISLYMIGCYIMSVNLLFYWLKRNSIQTNIAIFISLLFTFSTLLFQSHRQIMFVNYMPFFLLALIAIDNYIDKQKIVMFILSIFLVILHSYYYSISVIFVCFLYYLYRQYGHNGFIFHKTLWKKHIVFCIGILLAILMAGILLIPTMVTMLENMRSTSTTAILDLLLPKIDSNAFLYSPYGCGLTFISWLCLWLGVCYKKTRILSLALLIAFSFPLISYILNGTLYARSKILIVLLPIILFNVANVLQNIKKKETLEYGYIVGLSYLLLLFNSSLFMKVDAVISTVLLAMFAFTLYKKLIFGICFISLFSAIQQNIKETFVSTASYNRLHTLDKQTILQNIPTDTPYRFDDLVTPLFTGNLLQDNHLKKTSLYSSISSVKYHSFFYDVMHNPVRTRNYLPMLSSSNIFFQTFMGVRYLYTNNAIPIGYKEIVEYQNDTVVENRNVMPIAYATKYWMSYDDFNQVTFPYTLDTICNNVIVDKESNVAYQSKITEIDLASETTYQDDSLTIKEVEGGYQIVADKESTLKLTLSQPQEVLILSFQLENIKSSGKADTTIIINGTNNVLSSDDATYHNNNYQFIYPLSGENLQELEIVFSKGSYTLKDVHSYTMPYDAIASHHSEVTPLQIDATNTKAVMAGTIDVSEDGYFVTSVPFQNGMEVKIDNQKVAIECVNTAFIGTPITAGQHTIEIAFHAPGKKIGSICSIVGFSLFFILIILKKVKI